MKFDIRDLERLSGVKAHTIRMWEHRYGVPTPDHKKGEMRFYNLNDVELVLDIALLKMNGYKISALAKFSKEEIKEKLKSLKNDEDHHKNIINELLISMYKLDVRKFETTLEYSFIAWTPHIVVYEIIVPFLKKANIFWQGNNLTEEHLVVSALRKKLLFAIENIDVPIQKDKQILLFLPDSKQLDLGLLYASFYLRHKGIEVVYMGNNVSIDNLSNVFDTFKPEFLYTYIPKKYSFPFEKISSLINQKLPGTNLIITIHPGHEVPTYFSDKISIMQLEQALPLLCQ